MEHAESKGFERWMKRRAERAATSPSTSDDKLYEAFVNAATGAEASRNAGRAFPQIDGGAVVPEHITDAEIYQGFTDMLDGTAARKRAEENVRQDFMDRREELRRHAREMGTPIPPQYED